MLQVLKDNNKIEKIQYYLIAFFVITLPYFVDDSLVGTCSILIFILGLFIRKRDWKELFSNLHIIFLTIFILFSYLSLFWGISDEILNKTAKDAIERFKYFPLIIIGIYLSNLDKKKIENLLFFLAISPILYIVLYYLNSFGITSIYSEHYKYYIELMNRDDVFFTIHLMWDFKANVFIIFSLIYFYIKSLKALKDNNIKNFILLGLLSIVIFISLFIDEITDSRLMDIVAVACIMFITYRFISNKYKFFIFSIVSIFSIILVYNLQKESFNKGFHELESSLVENNYEGSWGFRVGMIVVGCKILKDNPFFGVGINSTKDGVDRIREKQPELLDFHKDIHSFHNEHILILSQVGIIGYFIFMLFIIFYFLYIIQNKEMDILKKSVILMYLLLMVADYFISNKSLGNTFALLLALFTLYGTLEKEKKIL